MTGRESPRIAHTERIEIAIAKWFPSMPWLLWRSCALFKAEGTRPWSSSSTCWS